ncbi:hypothetical protein BC940DRAFT_357994 [Gongronella butleri]|nr:hypothetical protein BC940DRAFT_357994 [Gongronella butleri]
MSQGVATTAGALSDINFGSLFAFDSTIDNKRKKPSIESICNHCQKAQLGCDGARPCQQCIKRDLATTCTDGELRKENKEGYDQYAPQTPYPQDSTMNPSFLDSSQLLNFSLADLGFGSETTGLEYGIIGNMLQTPLDLMTPKPTTSAPAAASTSTTTPPLSTPALTSIPQTPTTSSLSPSMNNPLDIYASPPTQAANGVPTSNGMYQYNMYAQPMPLLQQQQQQQQVHQQQQQQQQQAQQQQHAQQKIHPKRDTPNNTNALLHSRRKPSAINTPEQVYNSVRKPFNYAEGFHYLIQYVKQKMSREDLMRISRALALIRPSFLALIMNLTEEDLIFMEKCFQRTLLEYEKLINFSGTPTVVWRRTGEVCLAGKEFSLLTQWTKDALLGKKTYIYELMDNQSAVEYWEQFSMHAFDNTDKACIHSCILRTPQQRPVPCTFCFTIKRDIFDLPSVIVGNFLPILS